MYDQKRN